MAPLDGPPDRPPKRPNRSSFVRSPRERPALAQRSSSAPAQGRRQTGARARRGRGEGAIYYDTTRRRWEGQLRVIGPDGQTRRRKVTGATEDEVRTKLRRVAVDAADQKLASNKNVTVDRFLSEWAATALPQSVGRTTAQQYRDVIRLYIVPHIGRKRLAGLRATDVTAMCRDLADAGLSPNTIRSARSVLRRALRYAQADGHVTSNAAALSFGVRVPRPEGRTMTLEQARTFLESIDGHRLEAAWVTALGLGVRLGELLGLAWPDVRLDARKPTLTVSRALKRLAGEGLFIDEPKTASSRRTIFLPDPVTVALRAHRKRQLAEQLAAGPEWVPLPHRHDLVFRTPFGHAIDPANFRHYTYAVTENAGIGRWTPHELRHSAASILIAMGVPLKTVSEILGHSGIRVTADVYGHLLDESREHAADAMTRALGGANS